MRRTLLISKSFFLPGCRCVPVNDTAIMKSQPKIWLPRLYRVVPACQSMMPRQALFLSRWKEDFLRIRDSPWKVNNRRILPAPCRRAVWNRFFSKNSAATFFVSGLIRPYHKLKFLKLKEEHYGIFCKHDWYFEDPCDRPGHRSGRMGCCKPSRRLRKW